MPKLLPDRHPTRDFFVIGINDVVFKDDRASMEHPIFSLSTKPDLRQLEYQSRDKSEKVRVIPSGNGMATIFDKDILIYCISHLVDRKNRGEAIQPQVTFKAHDFLVTTNRPVGGDAYERFEEALLRLNGMQIVTTIRTGDVQATEPFRLISRFRMEGKKPFGSRLVWVHVELSPWMFRSIENLEVLTIPATYFRLRRPLERRIFEICRKHCGDNDEWKISLSLLQAKTGSSAPLKKFRHNLREIIAADHLPDYKLSLLEDDIVVVQPRVSRNIVLQRAFYLGPEPALVEWVRAAWPGMDAYALHREWWDWSQLKGAKVKYPDKAFQHWVAKKRRDAEKDE